MENLTLVEGKYFRVELLTKITWFDGLKGEVEKEILPLSSGLGIARLMPDKIHSLIIAYVKPHTWEYSGITFVDYSCPVGTEEASYGVVSLIDEKMPMEDFWEMMQEYRNCVIFAKQVVDDALRIDQAKLMDYASTKLN